MKASISLTACAAGSVLVGAIGAAQAASDTFVYEIVSGWTVLTDRARNFACSMEAGYEGGSMIRLGYESDGEGMRLVVGDPGWTFVDTGRMYAADVAIGDEMSSVSDASGVLIDAESGLRGLRFDIAPSQAGSVMSALMREYSVSVALDGREPVKLSLGGSYRAGLELEECQAAMTEYRDRSGSPSNGQSQLREPSAGR